MMRFSIYFRRKGYYHIAVPREKSAEWANLLFRLGILYDIKESQSQTEPQYRFTVSAFDYSRIIADNQRIMKDCVVSPLRGIPQKAEYFKRRLGLVVGCLLCLAVFGFLSCFAWEVRVVGAEGYDEELIRADLAKLGVTEGAFLPTLDTDSATTSFLQQSEKMSWMNIYRKGTVLIANCQPYEKSPPKPPLQETTAVNLIAKRDAVIEELLLEEGRPVVIKGAVVKKGDLLVSGVYENSIGYYFTAAKGEVKGKVTDEIQVFVPFVTETPTVEKSRFAGITLHLFGKDIPLRFLKSNSETSMTEDKRQIYLFDRIRLPIAVTYHHRQSQGCSSLQLSETEAMRLCRKRLHEETRLLLSDSELVSQKTEGCFTKEGYLLKCELTYIENIAESIEFSVN